MSQAERRYTHRYGLKVPLVFCPMHSSPASGLQAKIHKHIVGRSLLCDQPACIYWLARSSISVYAEPNCRLTSKRKGFHRPGLTRRTERRFRADFSALASSSSTGRSLSCAARMVRAKTGNNCAPMKNAQTQIGANPMAANTVHEIGKSESTK